MDLSTDMVLIIAVVAVAAVAAFFELRFMKARREMKVQAAVEHDDAYNAITTTKAVAVSLRDQGRDTNEADLFLYQAENAFQRHEYSSSIELAGKAKNALKNSKSTDLLYCPPSKDGEGKEQCVPAFQAARKMPQNYLESKFIIETVQAMLDAAGPEGSKEASDALGLARQAFDKEDYNEALRLALKSKRSLDPSPPVRSKSTVPSPSVYKVTASETISSTPGDSCPTCGTAIKKEDEFCPSCGSSTNIRQCSYCSRVVEPDDVYCRKCGKKLTFN